MSESDPVGPLGCFFSLGSGLRDRGLCTGLLQERVLLEEEEEYEGGQHSLELETKSPESFI